MAYLSRRARRDLAVKALRSLADEFREAAEKVKVFGETLNENPEAELPADGGAAFEEPDVSELESLKDELEEWKGNLPDNLQSSPKADELDEAISGLESAISTLESVTVPDWPTGPVTQEDLETLQSELEDAADEIENGCGEAEDVSFPGMFG